MTVRYHTRKAELVPNYICQRDGIAHAERVCQSILGSGIDAAISTLLMETLTPLTLEVALAVQQELQQRLDEADRLRGPHIERARDEADLVLGAISSSQSQESVGCRCSRSGLERQAAGVD